MNRTILCALGFLFFVSSPIFAQQSADIGVWKQEYDNRIQNTFERRTKQKPDFPKDAQYSKPDYIVFIPEVEPDKVGDMYNDHFQVFDKPDGTLFAVWCQASVEGALDQHVCFARCKDDGKTWEKPQVIAGNKTVAEGIASEGRIASWAFPMVSRSGRIYIVYNQYIPGKVSYHRQHTGLMMVICSDDDGKTWSTPVSIPLPRSVDDPKDETIPPEWVVWQKPLRLGKNGRYLVGVTHHVAPHARSKYFTVTRFIHFDNIDDDPAPRDVVAQWTALGDDGLKSGKDCQEPAIVKLPDGRLFVVMRSGLGSPVWSISDDDGDTWTQPKTLRMKDGGPVIAHPVSPCPIYDFKGNEAASGKYVLFAHNKYDFNNPNPWQNRGPLFLFAGRYQKDAEQPVWFDGPKRFIDRPGGNSFYCSLTIVGGKTVLWYPDQKFYLLGKVIGEVFFDGKADAAVYVPGEANVLYLHRRDNGDGKPLRSGPSPKLKPGGDAEEGTFELRAKIFRDRNYNVTECPKELLGKKFLRSKIGSVEASVESDGMLYVLTPLKDRNADSMASRLEKDGFEKVAATETLLFDGGTLAVVSLFQKAVKAGETIKLGKWSVLVY